MGSGDFLALFRLGEMGPTARKSKKVKEPTLLITSRELRSLRYRITQQPAV
ncbi:MAG: hypothetical protein WB566_16230 [Terriglobales bacterium]